MPGTGAGTGRAAKANEIKHYAGNVQRGPVVCAARREGGRERRGRDTARWDLLVRLLGALKTPTGQHVPPSSK